MIRQVPMDGTGGVSDGILNGKIWAPYRQFIPSLFIFYFLGGQTCQVPLPFEWRRHRPAHL
jgi:hypothetical protein